MTDMTTGARRISDRALEVTRLVNGPVHLVWRAWTTPDLFRQWWLPRSMGMTLLACDMDVREGGRYRLAFATDPVMEFFGTYLEVAPNARLVWTNDEGADSVTTTALFEDRGGTTLVTLRDTYASKAALDRAMAEGSSGMADGMPEQFGQLDDLLAAQG